MEYLFSKYLDQQHEKLKEIVNTLKETYQFVSVLARDVKGYTFFTSNTQNQLSENKEDERGFVFRVFKDGYYVEHSTNSIADVDLLIEQINNAFDISARVERSIYLKNSLKPLLEEEEKEGVFELTSSDEIEFDQVFKKSNKSIADIMEENEYIISAKYLINTYVVSKLYISNSKDIKQLYSYVTSKFSLVANKNDIYREFYFSSKADNLLELFKKNSQKITAISNTITDMLNSEQVTFGEYECILSPSVSGYLARNSFGVIMEGDYFISNRSKAKLFVNEKICSYEINISDLASNINGLDDEGCFTKDTKLVTNGVTSFGLIDSLSSLTLAKPSTGSGIRSSYKHRVYTRALAPSFIPEKDSLNDMIKGISYGFLIDYPYGSNCDSKVLNLSINAYVGKEIKDGKLTGKVVSPLLIFGDSIDIINSISKNSKETDYSWVDVSYKNNDNPLNVTLGGPYVKVKVMIG